ncbi:MAG: cyclic-di-AMP receptor [Clostridia bacterium]|nr:cyclic-di-AMP receptor [Clostridia bacterium]
MKLVVAIVSNDDANAVMSNLTNNGYQATKLSTSGGFLRAGNITLLIGVEDKKVDEVINLIGECSSQRKKITPVNNTYIGETMLSTMPVEVTVGGATIFVLDVEQFYKI